MSISKLLPIAALGAAFAFAPAQAAPAAPAPVAAGASEASTVTPVQWGYRRRGYGRGWGAAPWIGLGAGVVVGAIIADQAYRPRRGYYYDDYAYDGPYYYPTGYGGDPRVICAQNFRSFEWRTGLYTTYTGERRLCPYLR
jgi:BA14K-like protein